MNQITLKRDEESDNEKKAFLEEINKLKMEKEKLIKEMDEKDELLTNYVELDKEHQKTAIEWNKKIKTLNDELKEYKTNEIKSTETLLELKNENNKLQQNAVKNSLNNIKCSEKMDRLNMEIMELKEKQKKNDKQYNEFNDKYQLLMNQYKHIKQEKIVLVKEVKKCRQQIIEKDAKKTEILTKMSDDEMLHNKQCIKYEKEIEGLKQQHSDISNEFKILIDALTDCNSTIESFGDTINNFSYSGLIDSYDTEYEARYKSTELLNDTLGTNINEEVIKIHKELNFDQIRDELSEIVTDEKKEDKITLFEQSKRQITHIRLTALKLLMEYIESIKRCNEMYIKYHGNNNNGNEEEDGDGMYNYVTTGVISVASSFNPFSWKRGNGDGGGEEKNNTNNGYIGDKDDIKHIINGHFNMLSNPNSNEERIEDRGRIDDDDEVDNDNIKSPSLSQTPFHKKDLKEDNYMNEQDEISSHYLSKSAFLSVDNGLSTMEQDGIEINGDFEPEFEDDIDPDNVVKKAQKQQQKQNEENGYRKEYEPFDNGGYHQDIDEDDDDDDDDLVDDDNCDINEIAIDQDNDV